MLFLRIPILLTPYLNTGCSDVSEYEARECASVKPFCWTFLSEYPFSCVVPNVLATVNMDFSQGKPAVDGTMSPHSSAPEFMPSVDCNHSLDPSFRSGSDGGECVDTTDLLAKFGSRVRAATSRSSSSRITVSPLVGPSNLLSSESD
ncbi:hypothetical protein E2C01_040498 [Portunus trituberculatus]|uniref:FZ domain-containing protein n=1 Tax=Portunus trituberculatus TaxID=210409 RepID=A0A5B7FJV2_PORTR|nr:hypothetical protein [Portunus trituberculatus]